MLSLKEFSNNKMNFSLSTRSVFGGGSATDTTCREDLSTNDGCGDTKSTIYKEDGSVCCTEITDYCCPV